jgi:hypothetical protein
MPKIILVTGFHPNESPLTQDELVLQKLIEDLKKRRNVVEQVVMPEELSYLAYPTKQKTGIQADARKMEWASKKWVVGLCRKNPNAIVIEMHAREPYFHDKKGSAYTELKKPSKIRVRELKWLESELSTNIFIRHPLTKQRGTKNLFTLELIGIFSNSNTKIRELLTQMNPLTIGPREKWYFERRADYRKTRATNIYNERTIKRIGHLINTIARTRTGEFRRPRRPMYQTKSIRFGKRLSGKRG